DEPLANLDPAHQFDVLERLGKYAAAGNGVIVVLHDLTQAARFADDILIMNNGQILAEGPCQDVLTEDNIAEAYGISVQMETSDSGEPLVIPIGKMA
ncbi:MAG: ABC transporter ATP-binding protein, partial [Parasphingorhabdus sp.]